MKALPTSTNTAGMAFNRLVDSYKEYKIVCEQEETKRESIRSYKEVNIKAIEESSALLRRCLDGVFSERRAALQKMFDTLDKGILSKDDRLIELSLGGIVDIVKTSPLESAKLISDYHNPDVKMIEI